MELMSLSSASQLFSPVDGVRPRPARVLGWIVNGVRLADGTVLRLRGLKQGGRWAVERAAVAEFQQAMAAGALPVPV